MDKFISEHLINEDVDIYVGGPDKFSGKVIGNADGVVTLETKKDVFTHVATSKIIAIWKKKQP